MANALLTSELLYLRNHKNCRQTHFFTYVDTWAKTKEKNTRKKARNEFQETIR